ncbi:MAG TPA: trigger factor [Casimicrobiaceae bacterium]|nr:trigger factor [Casimicrobiaceae bacterium]
MPEFETLGQLERRLNVAVPLAQIEGEVRKRLAQLAKTVKIAGFRPGHVPLKMITQQYGPQVRADVMSDAVQKSFSDAVRDSNLRIAGTPRIEPRVEGASPDALEFSAVFEVYPEIAIGDLAGVRIERPITQVGDDDVARTLEVLRKQRATWAPAGRPAAAGDRVVVDFTGRIDGVEFAGGQAKDFTIELGEGRMLPEFEAALAGARPGEHKQFRLTFPADYHGKEVAGKTADFELDIKEVNAAALPSLDDGFAKAFGIASGRLDELRSEVTANLKLELKRKLESLVKEQVFNALRAQAKFPLPNALVEAETAQAMERMAADLKRQGVKAEDVELKPEMFRREAENRVALGLVVGELVRTQSLGAKPEQVRSLVAEAAQTYEQPDAVVRWHYEKPERLNEFTSLAVERNIMDWVLARATVVDTPTTFQAVMGPGRG